MTAVETLFNHATKPEARAMQALPSIDAIKVPFIDFTAYNYKQLRAVALAQPQWSAWAASQGVNAAFVSRGQLEQFLSEQFTTKAQFDAQLLKSLAAKAMVASEEAKPAIGQAIVAPRRQSPVGTDKLAQALAEIMSQSQQAPAKLDPEQIKAMVKEEAASLVSETLKEFSRVQITILDQAKQSTRKIEGLAHTQLPALLKACSARDTAGHHLNVWMHGPAGSGKTHAAKQVADALGLEFGFHGSMSMQHELVGFVDAGGKYHETQFVKRFRLGGLCLLDEVDSGENGPLLALQAALANGDMSLPNGEIVTRHKDFVCIAAGNTTGQGATADYVGRTKIDGAFLSRFPILISWGYDEALEQAFCGNKDFAKTVQAARAKAQKLGIKVLITPRHASAGAALIAAGASVKEAAEATYLSGMTSEQAKMMER